MVRVVGYDAAGMGSSPAWCRLFVQASAESATGLAKRVIGRDRLLHSRVPLDPWYSRLRWLGSVLHEWHVLHREV